MHIHVGTGTAARTPLTVPIADFRELGVQPGCAVLTPFFHVLLHVKPGMPSDPPCCRGVWRRSLGLPGLLEGSQAVLLLRPGQCHKSCLTELLRHCRRHFKCGRTWFEGSHAEAELARFVPSSSPSAGVSAGFPWERSIHPRDAGSRGPGRQRGRAAALAGAVSALRQPWGRRRGHAGNTPGTARTQAATCPRGQARTAGSALCSANTRPPPAPETTPSAQRGWLN